MASTIAWTDEMADTVADERSVAIRRAVALSLFILIATATLGSTLYYYGKNALHNRVAQAGLRTETNIAMLHQLDSIALSVAVMGAVGLAGSLLPLLAAAATWRRRVLEQLAQKAQKWQATTTSLQSQLTEARVAKEAAVHANMRLEEQVGNLTGTNAELRRELDQQTRAQRAFTQKRQELESSKSVLEIHVQARTQQLQHLQHRYEMILNSAGEGICGFDSSGKATFVNPAVARLTGWSVQELLGKTEQEIFSTRGKDGQAAPPGLKPDEQVFFRKDGTRFAVEMVKTPINEEGRPVGSVLLFKDITERKRADETLAQRAVELARSNAELEQFAFVASHDLQEPLRKIQAFGDRLKAKCEPFQSPESQDYLQRMQGAAARMRTLIDDLLAFSRVIRSAEPFVAVNLETLVKEVLGDLEVRIEKNGAKVQVGQLPTIEADPMQMRQLLLNLITNALKFQPPGNTPVVKLSASSQRALSGEEQCVLSVQDNGIGFEEKYLDKIFAVFQRLHGRSEYEGTGVGLAVCRRIVDRHHGTINARSKPGEGATFIVTLPVRQAKTDSAQ